MSNTNTSMIQRVRKHGEDIENLGSQLETNAIKSTNYTGLSISTNTSVLDRALNTDYIIYTSRVDYNGKENIINAPVEIKINFEPGQCKNADCITVNSDSATNKPMQFERCRKVNPFMIRDYSLYSDGSLKSGSIFIKDSFNVGDIKNYYIYVHANSLTTTYEKSIIKTENDSVIFFTIPSQNIRIEFSKTLKTFSYYKNNELLSYEGGNRNLYDAFIKQSNGTDISIIDFGGAGAYYDITYDIEGDGVVFFKLTRIFTHKTTKIKVKYIDTIFCDGTIYSDIFMQPTDILTVDNIKGFGVKCAANKSLTYTNVNNSKDGSSEFTFASGNKLSYKIYNSFLLEDYSKPTQSYSAQCVDMSEDSKIIGMNCMYQSSGISLFADSIFRIRLYVSSNLNPTTLANLPVSFATTETNITGRNRLVKNMKKFNDYMIAESNFSDLFKPLIAYVNIARAFVDGNYDNNLVQLYLDELKGKYNNCTTDGFKAKYLGGTGIEFIGRDTMGIFDIIKICQKYNNIIARSELISIVHNLADFYVWVETYSGGSGKVKLKFDFPDTHNSEATAMKYLFQSLSLVENSIRRDCYNRIKYRFESNVKFNSILPYSVESGADVVIAQQQHYQAFALFEYLDAVSTLPNFNISQYLYMNVNSCGKIDEIGSEYTSRRFGFIHSSLYWACVLRKYNSPSSLECANRLVENILSKCYATGGHMFPLDNWKNVQGGTIDQIIEVSICYNTILRQLL